MGRKSKYSSKIKIKTNNNITDIIKNKVDHLRGVMANYATVYFNIEVKTIFIFRIQESYRAENAGVLARGYKK